MQGSFFFWQAGLPIAPFEIGGSRRTLVNLCSMLHVVGPSFGRTASWKCLDRQINICTYIHAHKRRHDKVRLRKQMWERGWLQASRLLIFCLSGRISKKNVNALLRTSFIIYYQFVRLVRMMFELISISLMLCDFIGHKRVLQMNIASFAKHESSI